jgi:hypothetical protein
MKADFQTAENETVSRFHLAQEFVPLSREQFHTPSLAFRMAA